MPPAIEDLIEGNNYFVSKPSAVLRESKTGSGKVNQLLLGDWLRFLGETHVHRWTTKGGSARSAVYAKVRSRGSNGWLKLDEFGESRALEVNFVDIGQGDGCHIVTPDDKVLLIDAGISDNMSRFLSWRYNLRSRNVRRAPDFDPEKPEKSPWKIDYVVMSHPDEDHYGGFMPLFRNPKLSFDKVFHNGIVERPDEAQEPGVNYPDDLGGVFEAGGERYLYDYVSSTTELKALVRRFPKTRKKLLSTFRALFDNSKDASVKAVGVSINSLERTTFLESFGENDALALQLLGPIRERPKFNNRARTSVRTLGREDKTKNGHSVIFKAHFNKLTMLLGGDLNSQSQNFILQAYAKTQNQPEKLEKLIENLRSKKRPLKQSDQDKLDIYLDEYSRLETVGRNTFEVDIAKACHHGSQHVLDSFIRSVNAVATVISSGDNESHSHPRPDALGAYGKYGRGNRPLIFSTELARSSREFTPKIKNYLGLRGITLQIEAETDEKKRKQLLATLEEKKDRNVSVYGMITLRALNDTVIIAQKLEEPRSAAQKWDIYELRFDEKTNKFSFDGH